MFSISQLVTYAQWFGYATLVMLAVTIAAWIFQWGLRFRLVGVTSFMGVLTVGIFALSLGLHDRPSIPNALRFTRVYDTGANQVVVTVPPEITAEQLEATLQQAAIDLASPGRLSANGTLMVRARVVLHPAPGISQPIYLGQAQRSLTEPTQPVQVTIDATRLAQVQAASAT
jgi:hypothetical protein